MLKNPTGNFGAQAKQYDETRPPYPAKVLSLIASNIPEKVPLILDIGCGTGISTRQLAGKTRGIVIGCDIDVEMLKFALDHVDKDIAYSLGDARKIPFGKESFDMVTAFTAFHWFTDKAALKEIRRVLKKNGKLCTVQPRHTAPFGGCLRMILKRELKCEFPATYSNMNFQESLTKGGFKVIQQKTFKDVHAYTLDQYLVLLQSYSVWNSVPVSERERMLKILKKHFATKVENGFVHDTRDVEVMIAATR